MLSPEKKINVNLLLYFAWLVSIIATTGSLYFSEVLLWIPCDLCWYQRIFMYPLPILLGVAAFKQETKFLAYIIPLPIIGICISIYHYLMQQIPALAYARPCKSGVPCSGDYLNYLNGYVTIPLLALLAFLLIIISLLVILVKERAQ